MSGDATKTRLAIAQERADAARARLTATIGHLQERARPTSLVHDVTETLKERGTQIAVGLADTAKSKPARTGAVLAAVGLFLARRQVVGLIRRLTTTTPPPPSAPSKRGPTR